MQTQEADGSVLRLFIVTLWTGKGQVKDRQKFVTRSVSNRYRTAGRFRCRLRTGRMGRTGRT